MTLEQLIDELHNYYQFDIRTKSRKREIVYAKKVFCKLGYEIGHTYDKVSAMLNSNHDLALYHANSINDVEDRDKIIFDKIIDDFDLLIPKFNTQKKRRIIKGVKDNLEKQKIEQYKDLLSQINKIVINWDRATVIEFIETRLNVFNKAVNSRVKPKEQSHVPGAKILRKTKNTFLS
tara:strand:+ start:3660 stop:4190 length:531 start_codon:yes stop_codon:yes gene_type:complete